MEPGHNHCRHTVTQDRHGGAGAPCRGRKTGLHSGLRAADSEREAGHVAQVRVQRGPPAAAAGLLGPGRAADPGGVRDRGRAAAALRRLHGRRLEQGGVLREAREERAAAGLHEGGPGLRGPVSSCAEPVLRPGGGGEQSLNVTHTAVVYFKVQYVTLL